MSIRISPGGDAASRLRPRLDRFHATVPLPIRGGIFGRHKDDGDMGSVQRIHLLHFSGSRAQDRRVMGGKASQSEDAKVNHE